MAHPGSTPGRGFGWRPTASKPMTTNRNQTHTVRAQARRYGEIVISPDSGTVFRTEAQDTGTLVCDACGAEFRSQKEAYEHVEEYR